MATERELFRVRHDPVEWRGIVKRLLEIADQDGVDDRHLVLIDSLNAQTERVELSYRQAEWLLDARDDSEFVVTYLNFSIKLMLKECFENRFGIDDEDDQMWVEKTHSERLVRLRKMEAKRLFRIAVTLGVVEWD
ncbi:hypothetical protein [Brevundimonas sp. MEB006b]|uniref:hypothetical protein n=1 Tax=Brevundimonas sp. MEB006b TaxID=3040283 RepID=UPI00254F2599|nr:hypothetical protein [Brevundimonas sp. MEB006b]